MILFDNVKEKRRYQKFLIEGIDFQCRLFFATDVKIRDISLGGAALSLNKRLNMDKNILLKLSLRVIGHLQDLL